MSKILVIEDEDLLRDEVLEWLNFEGYHPLGAENGKVGIALLQREKPDLIICDITMPELDGYSVLLEAHAKAETALIPFIIVTARASHEDIRKGMELGADDYITKPFTRLELLHAVQARLVRKDLQEGEYQQQLRQMQLTLDRTQERHLLRAKLLAMFSHDFDGPISSILITSGLLRTFSDDMDRATLLEHIERIDSSARLLQQMREDIMIVAQIETGTIKRNPEFLIPAQFVERIINVFKAVHGDNYQIIVVDQTRQPINIDARLFRQITANLISNAMKYSPNGAEIRITLTATAGQLSLSVSDQGIGIPLEEQSLLFEPFHRCSNVGNTGGSGLGLTIVNHAVKICNGSLRLQSEVGIGTTITVSLPIEM